MDLRVMQYFLAVAKHENITKAAEELHLTQPTLSRQLAELEEELGAQLLIRGKRRTLLTEAGLLFKDRAAEILSLADKTVNDFKNADKLIAGDIHIACGETVAMQEVARVIAQLTLAYPGIRIHLLSGNEETSIEQLKKGLADFALLCCATPPVEYAYRKLKYVDQWGLFVDKHHPLAEHNYITKEDLLKERLIVSRQFLARHELDHWLGTSAQELQITATINLAYNGFFLAEQGCGSSLTFAGLANMAPEGKFKYLPLKPPLLSNNYIVWEKDRRLSRASRLLRDAFAEAFSKD